MKTTKKRTKSKKEKVVPEKPTLTTCGYRHHKEYGKYLPPCKTCGAPMNCGPFTHFCSDETCSPSYHRACNMCGSKVGYCSC